jgi:TatD DNase family protein
MNLTDTHCHLDFRNYDKDRPAVLNRAWKAGLEKILIPGIDLGTSLAATNIAEDHSQIFVAVGVHPNSSITWDAGTLETLAPMAAHPKVAAIGEIGMDYYRDRAPRRLQKGIFKSQLDLAKRLSLPVVIHIRNASPDDRSCIADVLSILKEWDSPLENPGVIHSYSGNLIEAQEFLAMGYFLGITGPVTFKKAIELQQVVSEVPLERLLIETDGPFLTPHPYRGRRNEPAYVGYIAEKIAVLRGVSPKTVANQTSENAKKLFSW